MHHIGILAYGSLIEEPGVEITRAIQKEIRGVKTPFCIEFARSSITRDGAPTVIPVESGGAQVAAWIFVLKEGITVGEARNFLWRRETRNEHTSSRYVRPIKRNPNAMIIEELENFNGVEKVLYTKFSPNISELTAENLAELAIKSASRCAGMEKRDGVSYLISLKRQGIVTKLMPEYEEAILRKTDAKNLEEALAKILRRYP